MLIYISRLCILKWLSKYRNDTQIYKQSAMSVRIKQYIY